ncbi:transposase [Enterococcus faecium EnGen0039]|nr:transposase [Enterococcus faecium EnGen0039]
MNHFKGKQFQQDVIIVAVGYYLRYNLSYREVQEILYDRGINVSHTTIYRWVQEYGKLLYQIWKKKNKKSFYSWKMDETYIKIKGKWHYLYRAIDADGLTLDIWLRKKRDTQAAYAFLKRLVKQFDEPKVVVTDKAPSITSAFKKLKEYGGFYQGTEHRTIKYLNNLIEQDHRPVKRRNKFYRSLRTASTTIKGMEAIRGLYKKTRKEGTLFGFSVCTEIKVLLGINVSHTTIYRWVQEYGKLLYQIWKKKNKKSFYSWKMDETYIKIKGKWHYLYRAIDADGLTLDIWLRKKRDTQAAYAFLKRLVKQFDEPKVVVTDKAPSITSAFKKLKEYGGFYQGTEHRTIKYLNNLIEQDHRPVKRRNKFYRSLRTASTTIKGMEAIRGLYKKTRKEGTLFGFSVCTEIKVLLGIPA